MSAQSEGVATAEVAGGETTAGRSPNWGVLAVIAVALVALFWPRGPEDRSVPTGTLIDDSGQPIELEARLRPVTLVHFWSTWCFGCLDEVPKMVRLEEARAGDPEFGVVMIAVSDDRQAVDEFITDQTSDRRHILHDDWTVAKAFKTDKLPETHLVVDGEIVETFVGATDWDALAVRQQIRTLVDEARAAAAAAS